MRLPTPLGCGSSSVCVPVGRRAGAWLRSDAVRGQRAHHLCAFSSSLVDAVVSRPRASRHRSASSRTTKPARPAWPVPQAGTSSLPGRPPGQPAAHACAFAICADRRSGGAAAHVLASRTRVSGYAVRPGSRHAVGHRRALSPHTCLPRRVFGGYPRGDPACGCRSQNGETGRSSQDTLGRIWIAWSVRSRPSPTWSAAGPTPPPARRRRLLELGTGPDAVGTVRSRGANQGLTRRGFDFVPRYQVHPGPMATNGTSENVGCGCPPSAPGSATVVTWGDRRTIGPWGTTARAAAGVAAVAAGVAVPHGHALLDLPGAGSNLVGLLVGLLGVPVALTLVVWARGRRAPRLRDAGTRSRSPWTGPGASPASSETRAHIMSTYAPVRDSNMTRAKRHPRLPGWEDGGNGEPWISGSNPQR